MLKRYVVAVLCSVSWVLPAVPAAAQQAPSREIVRVLQAPMDMRDFQNPGMTLLETVGLIYEKLAAHGIELPLLIDQQAFKNAHPDLKDVKESAIRFPPYPRQMSLLSMLQVALSQIPTGDATFVIQRGVIRIVPAKHAKQSFLLKQKIVAVFGKTPFEEAIEDLAEQTGVSIQLDSRVKDKPLPPVTAVFRNDTSLRGALVMLADMAGLTVLELSSGVYVTTPQNADSLRKSKSKQ